MTSKYTTSPYYATKVLYILDYLDYPRGSEEGVAYVINTEGKSKEQKRILDNPVRYISFQLLTIFYSLFPADIIYI